ncbi:TIGR02452 family protein [Asanoa siamensis]|uniref:TIGR02452 family protein n=1 Tax=Asanoa siamensis TaxID=926357 RepID=A0ABQ4CI79_9ACTN|nr:TIGR02452 family protein [Asanoa siamensis]GIF71012.1 TIGR02452 family protein [Asanoa siamensis]
MNRAERIAVAQQTLEVIAAGGYARDDGSWVDIAAATAAAVSGTTSYPPQAPPPSVSASLGSTTEITVTDETTITAARRLSASGLRTGALNFASARHPGGGFRTGAQAQEESLARSSALVACLEGNPMYAHHNRVRDPFYSDHMIFSPDVPFFRDDPGALLNEPFTCSIVTSPAVNAAVVRRQHAARVADIEPTMRHRAARIFDVAAYHGLEALVLGAWGCGVFANDPTLIADIFAHALRTDYRGLFRTVTFAVYDTTAGKQVATAFRDSLT